ncbi:MAG: metalloregulator ArsR/SmtB family transcription factor [Nocardioidaceae bacterium]
MRATMPSAATEERLDETFAALANATRRAILARLSEGEASVNQLAAPFKLSLPGTSKHLKVLERAGLIVRGQRSQYRPCTLDATPLEEISTWAEQYRPIWEASFDRMDTYLRQLQQHERTGRDDERRQGRPAPGDGADS